MSSNFHSYSGGIHRGPGAVARFANVCLVTPGFSDNFDAIDEFYERLGDDPTFEEVLQLAEVLIAELESFVAVGHNGESFEAAGFGEMEVVLNGEVVLKQEPGFHSALLSLDESSVVTLRAVSDEGQVPIEPYDLRLGVAPGGGITLAPISVTEPPEQELPVSEEDKEVDQEESALSVGDEMADPGADHDDETFEEPDFILEEGKEIYQISDLPEVRFQPLPSTSQAKIKSQESDLVVGKYCSREHFNPVDEQFCRICKVSLEHIEEISNAPRPTLGFIIFDDGSTYGLDRSYTVGRNPDGDETFEALRIYSDAETISRNHAEIRLTDWDVHVKDLGSTNGTFIWDNKNESWSQIAEGSDEKLKAGTTVALGRRAFVYESIGQR